MRLQGWWMLLVGSVLVVSFAMVGGGAGVVRAQDPPLRPTRVVPGESSDPPASPPTPVPLGRITGTVIEQTSGAPVPGVQVRVGADVLVTDANGNYDVPGLTAGVYAVSLELMAGQGEALQGSIAVQLDPGGLVVQHLTFRAPLAPTAVPPPSVVVAPVPATLPSTGATTAGEAWPILGLGLCAGLVGLALRRAGRR